MSTTMTEKKKRVVVLPSRGCCYYCHSSSKVPTESSSGSSGGETSKNNPSSRRRRRKRASYKRPGLAVSLLSTKDSDFVVPEKPPPVLGGHHSLALIYQPATSSSRNKIVLCRHTSTVSMTMLLPPVTDPQSASTKNIDGPYDLVYDDSIELVPTQKVATTNGVDDDESSTGSERGIVDDDSDDDDSSTRKQFFKMIRQQQIIGGDTKQVWRLGLGTENLNNNIGDDRSQTTTDDGTSIHIKRIGDEIQLDDDDDDGDAIISSSSSRRTIDSFIFPIVTGGQEETNIVIEPLQSLILSKVVEGSSSFETSQNDQTQEEENEDEDDPLLRSYWKRQMVGIVIASSSQSSQLSSATSWTTRINLRNRENWNHENSNTSLIDTGAVSFDVESFCVRTTYSSPTPSPRYHSPANSSRKNMMKFYSILPSTIITISNRNSTIPQRTKQPKLVAPPRPSLPESSQPPSDTARRLLETVKCLAIERTTTEDDKTATTATRKQFPTYPIAYDIPRSFLLSGPPGCGKTYSVKWVVDESNRILSVVNRKNKINESVILCSIRGSELLQANAESSPAQALKHMFETMVVRIKAVTIGRNRQGRKSHCTGTPVGLIFLDECDALVSVNSMAAMLADLLDRVSSGESYWKQVIVVGATNLIDSIPTFLRRAGRFDCEIPMSPPSADTRAKLLKSLLATLTPESSSRDDDTITDTVDKSSAVTDEELKRIADACVGYVPADLTSLVRKAWLFSLQRADTDDISGRVSATAKRGVTYQDLEMARHDIAPSALRGALLSAPPKISWDDIAGDPGGAKTALRQAIEWPRTRPIEYKILGLQPPRGILLHGPPGCGKTTLARAAAGATGVAFLTLSPAQVYASSYVGEAESIIRRAFALARSASPCILFFDEIDSLFGGSGDGDGGGGGGGSSGRGRSAEARVLSTFLNEMDGVDIAKKDGVLVLGGTNRPWTLDSALLRPGRLGDKIIYLPPPDDSARRSLFEKHFLSALGPNNIESWDWDKLIRVSSSMTGAEIVGACLQTKTRWLKHSLLHTQGTDGIESSSNSSNIEIDGGTVSSSSVVLAGSSPFDVESILLEELENIKPMLSNPDAMDEFRLFQKQ